MNDVNAKGHPLLFTISFMMMIFGLFFLIMGDEIEITRLNNDRYFVIDNLEMGNTFLLYSYEVEVTANKDMKSLTLILEYYDENEICLGQVESKLFNLDKGQQYIFSFTLPLDFDIERISVDGLDAIIDK